ncbi:MAG: lipoyl(octanoyl) transferase LipB [Anaerolineales bacterium]|jgi:lipoyl(octanoyl) transferase
MDSQHLGLEVHWMGLIPYDDARRLQEDLAQEIADGARGPTVLMLEHPHVYTFGRRGQEANLLWDPAELKRRGLEIRWIDRGGDVTYHGPGQLVGYPLFPLGHLEDDGHLPQADYVGYIRQLEESLIRALAELGLATGQIAGLTGVWVQPDVASRCPHCPPQARQVPSKIVSIGVKVDAQGISRHGFALNVNPDMSYWDGIIACGLVNHPQISLAELLDPPPEMEHVARIVARSLASTFGFSGFEWHDSGNSTS